MGINREERIRTVEDGDYVRRQRVKEYRPTTRTVLVSRITQFAWLVTAIIVGLIAFRFVLMLLGANPATAFVDLIYSLTNGLVRPFNGIVQTPDLEGGSVFDAASIFAMMAYLFGAWALISLFHIVFAETTSTRHSTTIERHID
jgi:uncharacterized protein YggT (Ycf19 family)